MCNPEHADDSQCRPTPRCECAEDVGAVRRPRQARRASAPMIRRSPACGGVTLRPSIGMPSAPKRVYPIDQASATPPSTPIASPSTINNPRPVRQRKRSPSCRCVVSPESSRTGESTDIVAGGCMPVARARRSADVAVRYSAVAVWRTPPRTSRIAPACREVRDNGLNASQLTADVVQVHNKTCGWGFSWLSGNRYGHTRCASD